MKGSINNIGHFWVSPKFRGDRMNRHGQQLLSKFLDWAREHNAKDIRIAVGGKNRDKAIRSYERAGFKLTGDTLDNMLEMNKGE